MRDNSGIVLLAYVSGVVFIGWLCLWSTLLYVTIRNGSNQLCYYDDDCQPSELASTTKIYAILLILSFYWTLQVSNNVLHTTVAGVVGTWYFDPSDVGAIGASAIRTLTFSFGSVCFGSLLVAIISTIRFLANSQDRNNGRGGGSVLYCVLDCILSLLESIMEYFNKWVSASPV